MAMTPFLGVMAMTPLKVVLGQVSSMEEQEMTRSTDIILQNPMVTSLTQQVSSSMGKMVMIHLPLIPLPMQVLDYHSQI